MDDKKKRKNRYNSVDNGFPPKNLRRGRNGIMFPSSSNYHNHEEPMYSDYDPNGSYTGICSHEFEEPIQDADDL